MDQAKKKFDKLLKSVVALEEKFKDNKAVAEVREKVQEKLGLFSLAYTEWGQFVDGVEASSFVSNQKHMHFGVQAPLICVMPEQGLLHVSSKKLDLQMDCYTSFLKVLNGLLHRGLPLGLNKANVLFAMLHLYVNVYTTNPSGQDRQLHG